MTKSEQKQLWGLFGFQKFRSILFFENLLVAIFPQARLGQAKKTRTDEQLVCNTQHVGGGMYL